jgi:hypothetical protein
LLVHGGGGTWKTRPGPSMILTVPISAGCPAAATRTHALTGPPGPVSADAAEAKTETVAITAATAVPRRTIFN